MNNQYQPQVLLLAFLTVTALGSMAMAQAPSCDRKFVQTDADPSWQLLDNWEEEQVPDSTHIACIDTGELAAIHDKVCSGGTDAWKKCTTSANCASPGTCIPNPGVEVGAIRLTGDPPEKAILPGEELLGVGGTLTLHGLYRCDGGSRDGDPCNCPERNMLIRYLLRRRQGHGGLRLPERGHLRRDAL